jgi:hypothetical protein
MLSWSFDIAEAAANLKGAQETGPERPTPGFRYLVMLGDLGEPFEYSHCLKSNSPIFNQPSLVIWG